MCAHERAVGDGVRTPFAYAQILLHICVQGVTLEEVSKVLRSRFGTSGIEEKAARPAKPT